MNIMVAMDSFKGSLSAYDLCHTIEQTLHKINNSLTITSLPISDGGEGTIDALSHVPHAKRMSLQVHNPLMKPILAHYLIIKDVCIIEMAQAAGLTLLKTSDQNPLYTTTYGVGEMIKDALTHGVKQCIISVGGSATHDGGIGMLAALGYRFYDSNHTQLKPIGKNLGAIASVDNQNAITIPTNIRIDVACDVTNPLTGPIGAAYVYAKQKGADSVAIKDLDDGLHHYMHLLKNTIPSLNITQPGLGAAGGLPLSLVAFFDAKIASGADLIFDMLSIDKKIEQCDLLITGEGKIDHQTFNNKAVYNLLKRAHRYHKPSIVLAGILEKEATALSEYGAVEIRSIHPNNTHITDAMLHATYTKTRLISTIKSLSHYFK